jgi:S1-C subfamily serine protease
MGADSDEGYEAVYRTAMPSVASVHVSHPDTEGGAGAGPGVVYDADGHLVTNQHVVGGASEVDLRFAEGDWRVGRVVGGDVVVGVEGTPIDSHEALVRYLVTEEPGGTVDLRVVRGGRETSEHVRLEARPDPGDGADGRRRRLRGR